MKYKLSTQIKAAQVLTSSKATNALIDPDIQVFISPLQDNP